jgi:hypothetical protein
LTNRNWDQLIRDGLVTALESLNAVEELQERKGLRVSTLETQETEQLRAEMRQLLLSDALVPRSSASTPPSVPVSERGNTPAAASAPVEAAGTPVVATNTNRRVVSFVSPSTGGSEQPAIVETKPKPQFAMEKANAPIVQPSPAPGPTKKPALKKMKQENVFQPMFVPPVSSSSPTSHSRTKRWCSLSITVRNLSLQAWQHW